MTVKDLTIGSPVYRVSLDAIKIARVRLIEQFQDGTRSFELNTSWNPRCRAEEDATEIVETSSATIWYINLEDAELAQLVRRAENVDLLKRNMYDAQRVFSEAIQRYAFSEPSTPTEL